jgi:hypothetical protein
MVVKQFVFAYARYRRLGFNEAESLDFALSRPGVRPITAGRLRRVEREPARDVPAAAPLRVVK